jgi:hypothetical protein
MNAVMTSSQFDRDYIRPLAAAENQLLQVLVDRFRILRKGHGFELQVGFNDGSPTIWLREAKRQLLAGLPRKQRIAVQKRFDEFIASNDEVLDYPDSSFLFRFPFRLGNGGTLPIVRMRGTDYYCLFYRDSHPTGWNIANGGANTRYDVLHPDAIIERELREELIIVEPERRCWYVFDWHDARLRDHPDFAIAQELWRERFRRQGFREFEGVSLPLKWSLPPDEHSQSLDQCRHDAMRIRCGDAPAIYTGQGFLNINAEDFGIEFDRIAKLTVGPQAVFCDGELRGDQLLNRVVGLFQIERIIKEMDAGQNQFIPNRVYWDGEERTGEDPKAVIGAFLGRRGSSWAYMEESLRRQADPATPGDPLDLCPVTRAIIGRHKKLRDADQQSPPPVNPFEVFLSFASEDRSLARQVFDHLSANANCRVFFSDVTLTHGGFADQIDRALDAVGSFVAVGTHIDHLNKSWVKYEWRNFHNDMKSKRKAEDAPFFAVVSGIDPHDLPRPLREQSAIRLDQCGLEAALAETDRRISKP